MEMAESAEKISLLKPKTIAVTSANKNAPNGAFLN
jgi:hypothetical protein